MSLGLPSGAKNVEQDYPEVWGAYAKLGEARAQSGPLDEKTVLDAFNDAGLESSISLAVQPSRPARWDWDKLTGRMRPWRQREGGQEARDRARPEMAERALNLSALLPLRLLPIFQRHSHAWLKT